MRLSAGTHVRLGSNWDGRGTNFALFSANAEKVELCLFDSQGRRDAYWADGSPYADQLLLVRPDGYIAATAPLSDAASLIEASSRWLSGRAQAT